MTTRGTFASSWTTSLPPWKERTSWRLTSSLIGSHGSDELSHPRPQIEDFKYF